MSTTAEIIGGLNVQDVAEGGTVFDIAYTDQSEEDSQLEKECQLMLQNYLKLECLDFKEEYDGKEPFSAIAKKMQNLVHSGKIKKRVLREGYGSQPELSSTINIHYNAYVQYEALPFDSTYARKKPFSFIAGQGEVIEGLETSVLSMKINEKSQFIIHPELAYREGVLGRIPSNAEVLFEIELCDIKQLSNKQNQEVNSNQFEIVYPLCLALCVKGKKMVKLKDFTGAIKEYKVAVQKLEDAVLNEYEEQLKCEELLVRLYTNLLICYTHAEIPKQGCVCAQKIYEMAQNKTFEVTAKVYFNHAKCQKMLGGFDNARKKFLQARALEPNNQEIQHELTSLQEAKEKYYKHQKNLGRALLR